jgi:CRP-like cAMP-binding protein
VSKINYTAGQTIIEEGATGDTAFMIESGSAEVIVGEGKKAKRVATLEAGDVFGEMCLLDPGVRSATVKALSPLTCSVVTYDDLMSNLESNPSLALPYVKTLIMRLRQMNQLMADMDPKKRGLLTILKDWQKAETEFWENMTPEERERHMMSHMAFIF